jgi:hypothetical protein
VLTGLESVPADALAVLRKAPRVMLPEDLHVGKAAKKP